MKKLLALILSAALFLSLAAVFSACAPKGPTFSLRIEGNTENIFYGDVELEEGMTLKDALVAFDEKNDSVTLTGAADDYITAVNGETAATFGGWDGWNYIVNGESPVTAMSGVTLSEGDEVVLYYGDPWGVGMAYPTVESKDGTVTFKTVSGSVANMKVKLGDTEYTTDENGTVTGIAPGEYTLSVELYAENGLNLVYRFAPGYKITVN